jgi:choline dehydrogenase-like flavoprotein
VTHPEKYDVVVLGSGAPGKLLAWTLASRRMAEGLAAQFSSVPRR